MIAVRDYTGKAGHFDSNGWYHLHKIMPGDLGELWGSWANSGVDGYYITIRGTGFSEFVDDGESAGGDTKGDDCTPAAVGDIVDCTDPRKSAGVLYIRTAAVSEWDLFPAGTYIAAAWKNRTADSIEFATANFAAANLETIKAAYHAVSRFPEPSFHHYTR